MRRSIMGISAYFQQGQKQGREFPKRVSGIVRRPHAVHLLTYGRSWKVKTMSDTVQLLAITPSHRLVVLSTPHRQQLSGSLQRATENSWYLSNVEVANSSIS